MKTPEDILAYWLDRIGPEGWYKGSEALDAEIREDFEVTWHRAMSGALSLWLTYPSGTLAYIILTDQFSRNMFRDTALSFASDHIARAAAKMAISKNWDTRIDGPARQFFYLPLVHSESLVDQDRAVRLIKTRMAGNSAQLLHARAHREVIRRFGRFPTRNAALGRANQPGEGAYIDRGGYAAVVRELEAEAV